ncbi:hypothetical protein V6N11_031546 [Hibiscus sabdariffa]|uniref:Letm1 RBD domain-containing protein n=1 Tax=Hibiscus sabdariffa TaxID=183260 RepID=A0ABR2SY01_9ROSI
MLSFFKIQSKKWQRSGEIKQTAEDLDEFLNRHRPRLVNMCKYMGISPFGTDAYLRYMLRKRLQGLRMTTSRGGGFPIRS